MAHLNNDKVRWVRWLAARGLPPDHIVSVLGADAADVAELLRPRPGDHHITLEQDAAVRELAARGETLAAIGEATGMHGRAVRGLLNRPPAGRPPDGPPPRRQADGSCPGRDEDPPAGRPRLCAARIAELLALGRGEVRDFLKRLEPVRRPRNGTGELTRPRSPAKDRHMRERRRRPTAPPLPDSWGYRDNASAGAARAPRGRGDRRGRAGPRRVLGAGQAVLGPAPAPAPWPEETPTPMPWGRRDRGNCKTPPRATQARKLRAAGMTIKQTAAALGCSKATVAALCMLAVDPAIEAESPRARGWRRGGRRRASAAPPPAPPSTAGRIGAPTSE